jgi:hypothetical protein
MEALILVATSGGPTMFAHIGVMRALNRRCSLPVLPSVSYLTEGTGRERILIGDAASWRAIDRFNGQSLRLRFVRRCRTR